MTGIQETRPAQTTRWHVVTGGPSSGKTTTVNLLRGRGYTTTIEHARHYIDLQRITGRSTAEVRARQSEFQRAVDDGTVGAADEPEKPSGSADQRGDDR